MSTETAPQQKPQKSEEMREIEREIRAHNLHADAVLLQKQRRAWKRSRPNPNSVPWSAETDHAYPNP